MNKEGFEAYKFQIQKKNLKNNANYLFGEILKEHNIIFDICHFDFFSIAEIS